MYVSCRCQSCGKMEGNGHSSMCVMERLSLADTRILFFNLGSISFRSCLVITVLRAGREEKRKKFPCNFIHFLFFYSNRLPEFPKFSTQIFGHLHTPTEIYRCRGVIWKPRVEQSTLAAFLPSTSYGYFFLQNPIFIFLRHSASWP